MGVLGVRIHLHLAQGIQQQIKYEQKTHCDQPACWDSNNSSTVDGRNSTHRWRKDDFLWNHPTTTCEKQNTHTIIVERWRRKPTSSLFPMPFRHLLHHAGSQRTNSKCQVYRAMRNGPRRQSIYDTINTVVEHYKKMHKSNIRGHIHIQPDLHKRRWGAITVIF